ncbi:MAG: hypothetical protein WAL20_00685, partial [Rhodomicrobium sp.]
GSALPPSDHTRRSLILIVAESHPDCRAAGAELEAVEPLYGREASGANAALAPQIAKALEEGLPMTKVPRDNQGETQRQSG